jgi:hypothetical protein
VIIGSSSKINGALICRSSSRVVERILSKIDLPSSTVQRTKTPQEVISKYSVNYVPNMCTKCCINIASRIDNFGPDKAS